MLPDLKSVQNLYLIFAFLVPGLVTIYVRSRFITGRIPSNPEAVLWYLTLSLIYYALALPFVEFVLTFEEPGSAKIFAWIALIFIGPALLGLFLGEIVRWRWIRTALERIGVHITHAVPSAWDWKFGNMGAHWLS